MEKQNRAKKGEFVSMVWFGYSVLVSGFELRASPIYADRIRIRGKERSDPGGEKYIPYHQALRPRLSGTQRSRFCACSSPEGIPLETCWTVSMERSGWRIGQQRRYGCNSELGVRDAEPADSDDQT